MDKEKVIFMLNSIVRCLTCMKDSELEKHFKSEGFEMDFYRFDFRKPRKTAVRIEMKEVEINE